MWKGCDSVPHGRVNFSVTTLLLTVTAVCRPAHSACTVAVLSVGSGVSGTYTCTVAVYPLGVKYPALATCTVAVLTVGSVVSGGRTSTTSRFLFSSQPSVRGVWLT